MSHGTSMTGQQRTITAFFDTRQDANEAIERLVSAGISRSDVNVVEGSGGGTQSGTGGAQGSVSTRSYPQEEGTGFWEALKDLFLPEEDRHTYAEGLRRGGYLVTVRATNAQYERAIDILDDEGTVDMGERESTWRSEGWTGAGSSLTGATGMGATGLGTTGAGGGLGASSGLGTGGSTTGRMGTGTTGSTTTGSTATGLGATGSTATGLGATGSAGTARTGTQTGDETIQLAEENLRVGKREVNEGRVRVRSYVVETPVEEQVNLRQENVSVERRPVDRAVSGTDNLFQDRTIEVEEKSEQAVVSKEARVTEELVVNKNVENRTETVRDTVRRTEVEVEDERGTRGTGTTGTGTDRKL